MSTILRILNILVDLAKFLSRRKEAQDEKEFTDRLHDDPAGESIRMFNPDAESEADSSGKADAGKSE